MRQFLPVLLAFALAPLVPTPAPAQSPIDFTRTEDVVYGRKFGVALTLDIIQPKSPNGYGIIYLVSGGWRSNHDGINPNYYAPYLERGYTVFAVCHGCQPKFTIPEIDEDINRAVRFIRHNAGRWQIKPDHLGVTGGSAGGHLSLTLGTMGGPGNADARDGVDRESSAVQAVACFYPPTDFLNYGGPGEDGLGTGLLKDLRAAFFAPDAEDTPEIHQKLGREISPIYHISHHMPPTLIIHGDADKRVPIQQSETFVQKATAAGATAKLIVKPGAGHGWTNQGPDVMILADWFDQYLRGIKK
ncbi:MAG TPA: alpha/beta hydrolase [Chthoniobacter sp.]|jgi:acetyl esterase/lipase